MRALVLSGGGGRGAYELGVYKALHEEGVEPDLVSGASIGATGAAFIAAGMEPDDIANVWTQLSRRAVYTLRRDLWRVHSWTHLLDNTPLRALLEDKLDLDAVRSSSTRILVTAVAIEEGEMHIFDNDDITVDHLMASMALPFVFPMVEIDGATYWDGGLGGITPLEPAIRAGATDVTCVVPHPYGTDGPVPTSPQETLERAFEVMATTRLRQDVRRTRRINHLVQSGVSEEPWRYVDLHVISPSERLPARVLTVDGATAAHLIDIGYRDGIAFLDDLQESDPAPGADTSTDQAPGRT